MARDSRDAVEKVLQAWRNGQFRGAGNMGTDGVYVYSYSEPIASTIQDGPQAGQVLVLVPGAFSQTTTKHCNQVANECGGVVHRVTQDAVKCRSLTPSAKGLKEYNRSRGH